MSHTCHADGCDVQVQPRMLMCRKHWAMVPYPVQQEIWATYRRGQEVDKQPSPEYMAVQREAVAAVAEKEGRKDKRQGSLL